MIARFSAISVFSKNLIRAVAVRGFAVKVTMDTHQVVPDVIPVAPTEVAKVSFAGGIVANEGNELKPRQVKDAPNVEWAADPNAFYTLVYLLFKFSLFSS